MAHHYTPEEITATLALLQANGGNLTRTSKETGVVRSTIRKWRDEHHPDETQIATLKSHIQASFLDKAKKAREAAATRALEILPQEDDLHKVVGAAKVFNDIARLEEGQATSIDEVRDALSDDERAARVEALLERARARRAGRVPPS